MISRAVKDYFRAFRLKELLSAESAMMYIYLLVWPIYFLRPVEGEVVGAALAIYYVGMIPMLLGMMWMRLNPIGLPKILFLLPMDKSQREEYVKAKFWTRFFVPVLMFVALRLIWWIIYPVQAFYLLIDAMLILGMLGAAFMTMTGNVKALEATKDQPKLLREKEVKGVDTKGLITFLIGLCTWFLSSASVADGDKIPIAIWILTILLLLWQMVLTVKMAERVKYVIPLACDYERMNV